MPRPSLHAPARPSPWVALVPLLLLGPSRAGGFDRPGQRSPERAFDILSVDLQVQLDVEARVVRGTVRYTARPLHEGPLVLDRVDVDILAVRGIDAAAPPHHVHPGHLVLEVDPEHLGEDGVLDVEIDFRAHPWTGVHFRGLGPPDAYPEVWTQGQQSDHRHWFPSWDHPNDRFEYTGAVTAPEGWRAVTNSGHDLPTYLIMFAAGPYDRHVHPDDPTTEVWVPPSTSAEAVARVLDPVPAMKAHFGARTGTEYPWGDYLQVFVQRFLYFGMENTGATINSARALVDDRVGATRPRIENLVAHELAHQWFGDLLTCRTWSDLWLNEGFATFLAADYVVARQSTEEAREATQAAQVHRWYSRSGGQAEPMARRWHHPPGASSRNVYNRGAATLWMLRTDLGEAAFWRGVRTYVARHAHGSVETVDLRRAFEDETGRDLSGFFQQWTEGRGSPTLQVRERRVGDELIVTVLQVESDERPLFHVPVEIQVASDAGVSTHRDRLGREPIQFRVPVQGEVRWVAADPRGAVLAQWTHDQSPPRLEAQALEAPAFARLAAIQALGDTDASEVLGQIAADTTSPLPYREAAADALGDQRAHAPLLAALDDPDGAVRSAVADALGRCPHPDVAPALRRVVTADPNPDVRAAALTALAKVDPAAAVAAARRLTRLADREETWLVGAALDVLGAHGEARDLRRLVDPTLPYRSRPRGLRAAAAWIQRQPDPRVRQAQAPAVARAAERLLPDLDLRTRQAALDVLERVGDDRSLALLEAHRRATRVPAERSAAVRAITAIRGRDRPDFVDPATVQQAALESLEDRLDALEARLEHWEDRH